MPALTNGFRLLQSSYAKGINAQLNRSGNLFQQKTKAKFVSGEDKYALTAFCYIHQNPAAAGIVPKAEDWPYSSFPDYVGLRNGTLCNRKKAIELLGLSDIDLNAETMIMVSDEKAKKIF